MTELPDPILFADVEDWIFDLDNTLYPHHSNLFSQIDVRMTSYVSELLAAAARSGAKSTKGNSIVNTARRCAA